MKSCACGGDMTAYGDGLYVCLHDDLGHAVGTSCSACLVYQRVTNARAHQ